LDAGRDVLLEIESAGAAIVKAAAPDSVLIFVLPPAFADLGRRIAGRSPMGPAELDARMAQVRIELARARNYDYVVINEDLDAAVDLARAIILAERCRAPRRRHLLSSWLEGAELVGHSGSIVGQADEQSRQ
jgi:guanylate kinase